MIEVLWIESCVSTCLLYTSRFYVGEPIALTIGRSGMSAVWIIGSPYNFGVHEDFLLGIRRCFVSFSIGALRMSGRDFSSKYVVWYRVVRALVLSVSRCSILEW